MNKNKQKKHEEAMKLEATFQPLVAMMADESIPWEHRIAMLRDFLGNSGPKSEAIMRTVLKRLTEGSADSVAKQKLEKLQAMMKEMEEGPMRQGYFIDRLPADGRQTVEVLVLLDDGTRMFTKVADKEMAASLRRGDHVLIEAKGRALLRRIPNLMRIGDEARLERRLPDGHVEVTLNGDQKQAIFLATQDLVDQLDQEAIEPGATLIVDTRLSLAFDVLPPKDGLSHYRFLVKTSVPDVVVERDIGAPPRCIEEIAQLIRLEMTQPELRRRYRLRSCVTKLLAGVSGSGKTLAVLAIHRLMYEIMSDVTGVPIDELPPRVFRFRPSQLYSMWLGESDKNMDRLFDEVETLAAEPFVAPDGKSYTLPCLAILEEVEGMARSRGQDPIYDRILTTALQRLDPTRKELKDRLIVFLATTNEAHLVDRAFLRRVGGSIETFHRLNRQGFRAVLQKHITDLPVARTNGHSPEALWTGFVNDLTTWLYSPNGGDPGVVELTYAGTATPAIKYRRDFLTGSLVDRAVQQAAEEASQAEYRERNTDQEPGSGQAGNQGGVTLEQLMRALDGQVRSIVDQLREHNAGAYLDLPDGSRVASVRRIQQPTRLPQSFQRH